ncbi:MAG: hypothetical protein U1F46_04630 [Marinagarivorans sp.]
MKSKLFCVSIICAFLVYPHQALSFPTADEIQGVQTLCGAGNLQSLSFKTDVNSAIKSWRDASVGANAEIAKKNLTGALSQIKEDKYQEPMYKLYLGCVSETLQKYFETENKKPKPISARGTSSVLLRSAYATNQAIKDVGCNEAKEAAMNELISLCANGNISNQQVTCPDITGSPRTYSALISATCTPL